VNKREPSEWDLGVSRITVGIVDLLKQECEPSFCPAKLLVGQLIALETVLRTMPRKNVPPQIRALRRVIKSSIVLLVEAHDRSYQDAQPQSRVQ
jgi:hypothetical protein